jgi:uncharacterized membrane protein YebE (DUF533 family)
MLDPKNLLDQMFGSNVAGRIGQTGQLAKDRLNRASGVQGFAGGAAAGSLLGLLLGGKKMRKLASGALGYGGAAALGALAHRAYQNYMEGRSAHSAPVATPDEVPATQPAVTKLPARNARLNDRPFELVLIEAMVAAAKADGHVDAQEQKRLFAEVERKDLDAESKAYVFDLLSKPSDLTSLATAAADPELAGEVYLASRLAIDPDNPAEQSYLDALASRLGLPGELRAHLERQAVGFNDQESVEQAAVESRAG